MGTCSNRLDEAVLTSTHNVCFRAKIRKIMYTPVNTQMYQFYYIKMWFKGVKIIEAFFRVVNIYTFIAISLNEALHSHAFHF